MTNEFNKHKLNDQTLKLVKRIKKEIFSLSEIGFNESNTYQGRDMGVKKMVKRKKT